MKKLLTLAAMMAVGVVANAASFNWQAANIYGSDGVTKYSGTVTLYAIISGVDTAVQVATASAGAVTKATTGFSNDNLVAGEYYDFFFVIEDGGKTFMSDRKENILAQATSTITVNFGNMAPATQNAGNWSAVPEPTSGLLMLIGVAGLALRRRRA